MSDNTPIYLTCAGAERRRKELHTLLYTTRPELVRAVELAASNGDFSENADYQYNKRALRKTDGRIHRLTKMLESAAVIDPVEQAKVAQGRILFGATVTVEDESGQERRYSLVGGEEVDPGRGRISFVSPLGRAMLRKRAGDEITFMAPGGERELAIVAVAYLPLP